MKEDLNRDGRIDARDIALMKSVVVGHPGILAQFSAQELAQLDLNGDGRVDESDLSVLYGKLLSLCQAAAPGALDKLHALREKIQR